MKFLILLGTVREGRYSKHAAEALKRKIEEKEHQAEIFDPKETPLPFLQKRRRMTEESHEHVEELGEKVEESDCLILTTPEYNRSVPGVLKNALDHLYHEYDDKPFAYHMISGGGFGGVRALTHLHEITLALGGKPGPDLPTSHIRDKFNEEGELTEEDYEEDLDKFVEKCVKHVKKTKC
ncbi:MAG: NADPH-dependent FMN reductase [Candidatus Nanohaloarchaea archaeon]